MKNINWWKVASMAMLAASAIMGFGSRTRRQRTTCGIWFRKKFASSCRKRTSNREKFQRYYGEILKRIGGKNYVRS